MVLARIRKSGIMTKLLMEKLTSNGIDRKNIKLDTRTQFISIFVDDPNWTERKIKNLFGIRKLR